MLIALTEKTDRNRIPFQPAIHLESGLQAPSTAAPAPKADIQRRALKGPLFADSVEKLDFARPA
jgi:hypothetical protein